VTVGFPRTKNDVDSRAGQLAMQLRDVLADCAAFCDFLNDTSIWPNNQAFLDMTWTQAEIDWLRNGFTDAKKLRDISHATATQSATNDFFFNLKHLWGALTGQN
jgi:hypothetical protein